MTRDELALLLNGREYRKEITTEEAREAEAAGLVVVFGASDDVIKLSGAIKDEADAYGGGEISVTRDGLLANECDSGEECPYFAKIAESATTISASGPPWKYETIIHHSTFDVLEDGEVYCKGIVFALEDVP